MRKWRQFLLPGLAIYAAFLTFAGAFAMLNPDIVPALRWRLGLSPYDAASYKNELHKYHTDKLAFAQQPEVILLGDSHMQRLDAASLHPNTLNLGIGGLRADELHQNLTDYKRLREAKHLIVSIGLNDLENATRKAFDQRTKALIEKINAYDTPWTLLEILPVDTSQPQDISNEEIDAANATLRALCNAPCRFLPTQDFLSDRNGDLATDLHEGDGQHLNLAGYAALIERLRTTLSQGQTR
ncbi:GDSL-type esterase/lipase family protein [Parvularcula sp. IMCC14364]|uniref:GDSL-type esterase/lipase family protein n=1 Tax=Parvularcula sp. IMCC14364 TaxID=3067902 RepID=UPI0027408E86|nr:GDSL-type esterase/lipase family protein [Parvularcula sp. IMCC14364]